MSFRLLIECSKDLDSLQINFSDGTSVFKEVKSEEPEQLKSSTVEDFLNTDSDYGEISQEKIVKPTINVLDRPVNVASELQNLDI